MEFIDKLIFFSGLLLCLSVLAGAASSRIGAPLLLAFLSVGVFFGQDGVGGIVFNDMQLSYSICSFALAIILFDGGIHTSTAHFRQVLEPAFSLATLGVLLTTGITGGAMWYFLDIGIIQSLLFGAIVASTDAAAVFLLLRQNNMQLDPAMTQILEVESGINDPMAIFLTLLLVDIIIMPISGTGIHIIGDFVQEMGLGAVFGFVGGRVLTWCLQKITLESALCPIFALAGALLVFGATNLLGGSGFLAVYVTGLLLGNRDYQAKLLVQQFMDGMAWLAQLCMLLILGLLVTPSAMTSDIPVALFMVIILIFIARPVAVFISLAFARFSWREKCFISWVGLRGAIPIYLAIIPVMQGLSGHYFNIAFIAVVCSLFLQGWTIRPVARWLNVAP